MRWERAKRRCKDHWYTHEMERRERKRVGTVGDSGSVKHTHTHRGLWFGIEA